MVFLCAASSALARPSVLVLPFVPEEGVRVAGWPGYAMSSSVAWKLGRLTEVDVPSWTEFEEFYTADARPWPAKAFSESDLRDLVQRCGVTAVVVGRYALGGDGVRVRCRVWAQSAMHEVDIRFRTTTAPSRIGDLAVTVARLCGLRASSDELARMAAADLNSSDSFNLLGRLEEAKALGRDQDAMSLADEWARVDPDSALACYRQAELRRDDPGGCISWLAHALKKEPEDRRAWQLLGDSWIRASDFRDARRAYRTAAESATERDRRQAALREARRACRRAARIDPTNPCIYLDLAIVEQRSDQLGEAARLREKAEGLAEGWLAHLWLAQRMAAGRLFQPAVERFELATRLGAPRAYTSRRLGALYYDHGRLPDAVKAWQVAVSANPRDSGLLRETGGAYSKMRRFYEAEHFFRSAIRIVPKDVVSRNALGWALYSQGEVEEAVAQWQIAAVFDPGDQAAHTFLARAYARKGDFLQSMQELALASPEARQVGLWIALALAGATAGGAALLAVLVRRALTPARPDQARQGQPTG